MEKNTISKKIISSSVECTVIISDLLIKNQNNKCTIKKSNPIFDFSDKNYQFTGLLINKEDRNFLICSLLNLKKNILVYDLANKKLYKELESSGIHVFLIREFKDSLMISAHSDGILLVWNYDYTIKLKVETNFQKTINNLVMFNNWVVISGSSGLIRYLEEDSFKFVHEIDKVDNVRGVKLLDKLDYYKECLVSIGFDQSLRVWSKEFKKVEEFEVGRTTCMLALSEKKNILVLADSGGDNLTVWDLQNKTRLYEFELSSCSFSRSVEIAPNLILFGGSGSFQVWNFSDLEKIAPVSEEEIIHAGHVTEILVK